MPKPATLPPREWGKLVKQRRELLNMKQDELAETTGVAQATIVRVEKGEQFPSLRVMKAIATALHCNTIDDLFPYPPLHEKASM